MSKRENIESVRGLFEQFAKDAGMEHDEPETIAGDLICHLLHFLWSNEVTRKEGVEKAMDAVHSGLYHFAGEIDYPMDEDDDTGLVPKVRIIVDRFSEVWETDAYGTEIS